MKERERTEQNSTVRTAAVIMECNPFHEGHRAILQAARAVTGAAYVIVLLSGDFVQRGEPAILPKEQRVRDILSGGADLVLELPVPYATGAADWFARGAMAILSRLGVVTDLVFGSGSGDLDTLWRIAGLLREEPPAYQAALKAGLSEGLSYPAARAAALQTAENLSMPEDPNDILGIEYLKALHGGITPHAIRRRTADSASELRRTLRSRNPALLTADDLSSYLYYAIWQQPESGQGTPDPLTQYADISPDLANRIRQLLPYYGNYSSFADLMKTRNYTRTRICRALLHLVLGITKTDLQRYESAGLAGYVRVLGLRAQARPLLSRMAGESTIPVLTRAVDAGKVATPFTTMLGTDLAASTLYDACCRQKRLSVRHGSPAKDAAREQAAVRLSDERNRDLPHTVPERSKPLILEP